MKKKAKRKIYTPVSLAAKLTLFSCIAVQHADEIESRAKSIREFAKGIKNIADEQ